jgi:hypothetical protein
MLGKTSEKVEVRIRETRNCCHTLVIMPTSVLGFIFVCFSDSRELLFTDSQYYKEYLIRPNTLRHTPSRHQN